jgi:hypothetical protein
VPSLTETFAYSNFGGFSGSKVVTFAPGPAVPASGGFLENILIRRYYIPISAV